MKPEHQDTKTKARRPRHKIKIQRLAHKTQEQDTRSTPEKRHQIKTQKVHTQRHRHKMRPTPSSARRSFILDCLFAERTKLRRRSRAVLPSLVFVFVIVFAFYRLSFIFYLVFLPFLYLSCIHVSFSSHVSVLYKDPGSKTRQERQDKTTTTQHKAQHMTDKTRYDRTRRDQTTKRYTKRDKPYTERQLKL